MPGGQAIPVRGQIGRVFYHPVGSPAGRPAVVKHISYVMMQHPDGQCRATDFTSACQAPSIQHAVGVDQPACQTVSRIHDPEGLAAVRELDHSGLFSDMDFVRTQYHVEKIDHHRAPVFGLEIQLGDHRRVRVHVSPDQFAAPYVVQGSGHVDAPQKIHIHAGKRQVFFQCLIPVRVLFRPEVQRLPAYEDEVAGIGNGVQDMIDVADAQLRNPVEREHSFWLNVNTDSGSS